MVALKMSMSHHPPLLKARNPVCMSVHKAVLYNYVVILKYEILATVHVRTHTHIHTHTLSAALAAYDVITGDEILALFTLEMILTVERNIHQ